MTLTSFCESEILEIDKDRVDRVLKRLAHRREKCEASVRKEALPVFRRYFETCIPEVENWRRTLDRDGNPLTAKDRQRLTQFEAFADPGLGRRVLYDDHRGSFKADVVPIGSQFCIGGYHSGPHGYSRESKEEWASRSEALAALETGAWTLAGSMLSDRKKGRSR